MKGKWLYFGDKDTEKTSATRQVYLVENNELENYFFIFL